MTVQTKPKSHAFSFGKFCQRICIIILTIAITLPLSVSAATFQSDKSGNYGSNSTWRHQYELKYGSYGSGPGLFATPQFITTDSSGNAYVTDSTNNNVQKFDSNGNSLVQFGSAGAGNGQFGAPSGIAVDSSGNIFVADSNNHRIQKFNSSGVYQSQFGTNGTGNGQFQTPAGIKIDSSGNIFVAERDGSRIQKFNSSGVYQSQFGSFGFGPSDLLTPNDIAIDGSGNIYVADNGANKIKKFNSSGVYQSTLISNGSGDGAVTLPFSISFDSTGNLYVTDQQRVQMFDSAGTFRYVFGTPGGSGNGQYLQPKGINIGPTGEIYIAEGGNARIQKFSAITSPSSTSDVSIQHNVPLSSDAEVHNLTIGASGIFDLNGHTITVTGDWTNLGTFNANNGTVIFQGSANTIIGNNTFFNLTKIESTPSSLFLPNATTTITNNLILQGTSLSPIDVANSPVFTAPFMIKSGSGGTGDGRFDSPRDIWVDAAGYLYVTDTRNDRIQKFNSSGTYVGKFGSNGSAENQFDRPQGVAVDEDGNIYVADTSNSRIQKYDSNFTFIKMWGWGVATGASQFETCTSGCTYGSASDEGDFDGMIWSPSEIVFLPNGNLAVSQSDYNWYPHDNVIEFDRNGNFVTRWGRFGYGGNETVIGSTYGMDIDAQGNYYLADSGNHRLMKFDSNHAFLKMWGWGVATGASQFEVCTSGCHTGISGNNEAQFEYITGVKVDPDGNVLVADEGAGIQRFTPEGQYIGQIAGNGGNGDGELSGPTGMALTPEGDLWVMDRYNNRMQKFDLPRENAVIVPQGTVTASNVSVEGIVNLGSAPISCLEGCTDEGGE